MTCIANASIRIAFAALTLWGMMMASGDGGCSAADHILGPLHRAVRLPEIGSRLAGFSSRIRIADENTAGYTPVEITVEAVGTLAADRRLIFRFETQPGGQTPPRNGLTIDVPINVSQGTKSETFVRYLPKWSAGQALEISVLEEGRVLEDYLAFIGGPLPRNSRGIRMLLATEQQINWVFIGSDDVVSPATMPDLRGLFSAAQLGSGSQLTLDPISEAEAVAFWTEVMVGPALLAIGQSELPLDWRAYQRYDVIAIETKGLQRLQANDEAMQAVRSWVLNGGSILVYDAESQRSVLKLLNFRQTNSDEAVTRISAIASELTYYIRTDKKALKAEIDELKSYVDAALRDAEKQESSSTELASDRNDLVAVAMARFGMGGIADAKAYLQQMQKRLADLNQIPQIDSDEWSKQVWMQHVGAGCVIGIQDSDQYTVPPPTHLEIAARTIGDRASPMLRRGVDPMIGDGRFLRWLIPGVAQPPVYTFMGLLTAFVVLVGPVAYRRTAKYGRTYLMFAIAPVLALLTTVAMFGYGIVSDGFGTVVRARQLTWVDGVSGDAGERVRTTYFAGVRPGGGLRFPGDAEVSGYPENTGRSWETLNELSPATIGNVVVRKESQDFESSFLPSRQQRQFVVHSPKHNVGYLQLVPHPTEFTAPSVLNGFDFELRDIVLRDDRGSFWSVERLQAGETTVCQAQSSKDASKMLGRMYNDYRPLSSVREASDQRRRVSSEIYDLLVDTSRQLNVKEVVTDGIFEQWLQQHLQTMGEIPAEHFVAIADVSRDVLAVEESELAASVRYVFGTLR